MPVPLFPLGSIHVPAQVVAGAEEEAGKLTEGKLGHQVVAPELMLRKRELAFFWEQKKPPISMTLTKAALGSGTKSSWFERHFILP